MAKDPQMNPQLNSDGTTDSRALSTPSDPPLDWWHRDHPTFTALAGFFTGLVFVIVIPGAFIAVLSALLSDEAAEGLFPLVLVALVAPVALVAMPRTRRFGKYMLVGMVITLLVVVGVAMLVLWYMVRFQS